MVIGGFIFIVGVFPQEKAVNLHQARAEALIFGRKYAGMSDPGRLL